MTKATMPEGGGGSDQESQTGRSGWRQQMVEIARTIAPGNHAPGVKILHRRTKWIKLDRTITINGKVTNLNQVFHYLWSDKNVLKV